MPRTAKLSSPSFTGFVPAAICQPNAASDDDDAANDRESQAAAEAQAAEVRNMRRETANGWGVELMDAQTSPKADNVTTEAKIAAPWEMSAPAEPGQTNSNLAKRSLRHLRSRRFEAVLC